MKKFFYYLIVITLFASCKSQFPIAYNPQAAKDPNHTNYIKPKNEAIISSDTLEIKNQNKLFKATTYNIAGRSFKANQIESYQDKSGYYLNIPRYGLTQSLTGPRINVFRCYYTSTTYDAQTGRTRTSTRSVHIIKKAGQPDLATESLKITNTIAGWVEDNNEAYEQAQLAQMYVKKIKTHRLISWGAIIGGFALMIADPSVKSTNPNAKPSIAYAGAILVPAGMINLGLNLGRRGKVGRSLASAINIYNEAPEKKKKR
ncbi:MAG: hypothetical protein V4556_05730 [Bacteroidota bacterium]